MLAAWFGGAVAAGGLGSRQVRCAWWRDWWRANRVGRPQAQVDLLLCSEQQGMAEGEVRLAVTVDPGNA